MKRSAAALLVWALSLPVSPALAQTTMDPQISDETSAVGPVARVVTEVDRRMECLAPLTINLVDGVKQAMPKSGFSIEPGFHRLNGLAWLDTTRCRSLNELQQMTRADDLEVNFEAGRAYYLAYDLGPEDPREWKIVVWKTEELPLAGEQNPGLKMGDQGHDANSDQ